MLLPKCDFTPLQRAKQNCRPQGPNTPRSATALKQQQSNIFYDYVNANATFVIALVLRPTQLDAIRTWCGHNLDIIISCRCRIALLWVSSITLFELLFKLALQLLFGFAYQLLVASLLNIRCTTLGRGLRILDVV